jgi:hypothetical protein
VYAVKNAPVTTTVYTVPDIKLMGVDHFGLQPA